MGLWAQTKSAISAGIEAARHQFADSATAAGSSASAGYDAINPKGRRKERLFEHSF